MTTYLPTADLEARFKDLQKDLLDPRGPQLSTIRSYRFAIFHYDPKSELEMRRRMAELSRDLEQSGWHVIALSAVEIFLTRLRKECRGRLDRLVSSEQGHFQQDPTSGVDYLQQQVTKWLEGKNGIAADVAGAIQARIVPGQESRTVVFIGRLGSFYPFYRTSALLRFLDGAVPIPVILLYPGLRTGERSLSFMGVTSASDSDYRPHIY